MQRKLGRNKLVVVVKMVYMVVLELVLGLSRGGLRIEEGGGASGPISKKSRDVAAFEVRSYQSQPLLPYMGGFVLVDFRDLTV